LRTFGLVLFELRGFETYLPLISSRQAAKVRATPLFPGYCFLKVTLQWTPARWAPGVTALLMNGIEPARVADQIIAERRLDRAPPPPSPAPRFQPGDQVRIQAV
jgi:transcription antitermination factor NusG